MLRLKMLSSVAPYLFRMNKKENKPAALDHALYEMAMLVLSLPPVFDLTLEPHIRSGWLEVFAIHSRNLNEFFGKKNQRRCYMKPEDFVSEWRRDYVFNTDLKERADLQVAHLTYERQAPEEKTDWAYENIFTNLRVPCLAFLEAVRSQKGLMEYHDNRNRTDVLLSALPNVKFVHADPPRANVASVWASVSKSPLRYYPTVGGINPTANSSPSAQ